VNAPGRAGNRRQVWAWALVDWGNSAFATVVMAGFFPVFFKGYWAAGLAAPQSTFRLGLANAVAGLFVVILAPALGALADQAGAKKRFLLVFTALGVLSTSALFWGVRAWSGPIGLCLGRGLLREQHLL
jgi:UMF1 family MFS transporter